MKKFNPDKELQKLKERGKNENNSRLSNMYVPILVIACSCLAMAGITFSANLVEDSKNLYTVRVDIINGDEDVYIKTVKEGAFSDTINSDNTFGSISCTSGELSYNPDTKTISSPYLNKNTSCVISFMDDVAKKIEYTDLNSIADNAGISYYYKADATNNYLKIDDMMFRIVRINGDGSYRIILNDSIMSSNYGENNISYFGSNLETVLNNWLFSTNFGINPYVVDADYDITNYYDIEMDNLINPEGHGYFKVGTLSAREVALITDGVDGRGYLKDMILMNPNNVANVYAYVNGELTSVSVDTVLSVRPVINIVAELEGFGTETNPYTIK